MSSFNGDYKQVILDGVEVLRASNEPCPVCGHPTGNCAGTNPPPYNIAGLGTIPSMRKQQTILVEEDIWEKVEIATGIFTRVLRAKAGTQMPYDKAVELGLVKDANLD